MACLPTAGMRYEAGPSAKARLSRMWPNRCDERSQSLLYRSPYRREVPMTVSHCSIVAYTYHATFSSRASPHDLVHSPWLRLRAKLSVHVSTEGCEARWHRSIRYTTRVLNELELLELECGRIVALRYRLSLHTSSYRSGTACACQLLRAT